MGKTKGIRRRDGLLAGCAAMVGTARTAEPLCVGDEALCRLIVAAGADGSNTHAVVVERAGRLLAEAYFTGRDRPSGAWFERELAFGPDTLHDLRSISKSVTGLLVGIVHGRGLLGSLNRPLFDLLPEHADLATPDKRAITLNHLLDFTVGWEWDEWTISYADPSNSETRMASGRRS